jgi:prevent-host-death family protein
MATMEHIATNDLRNQLGRRIDEAHYGGKHLVVEKNGEPRAVLVPYDWWQQQGAMSAPQLRPEQS